MKAHLRYLSYVVRHKWFVFVAGLRMGAPLWRLLIHDWSKFTPTEWGPYVRQFFNTDGSRRRVRRPDGGYDPNAQAIEFRRAWLSHQRNRHHWQAWVSIGESGSLDPLPMPDSYIREMVADWMGAGRAITGRWGVREWYSANRDRMILHHQTRSMVDSMIGPPTDSETKPEPEQP